jgi:hypothetical protein
MKSALKRLSSQETEITSVSAAMEVKTIILSNASGKTALVRVLIEKNDGSSSVIFNGNVYPNLTESVYSSKDVQFFLESGEKIKASAHNVDGSDPGSNVVDMILSYV